MHIAGSEPLSQTQLPAGGVPGRQAGGTYTSVLSTPHIVKRIEVVAPRLGEQGDQLETTPGVDNLAQ